MTFALLALVAVAAGQVVLNRIPTTDLNFHDLVCGFANSTAGAVEGCATVTFSDANNADPCIPATASNCLVGSVFTDFDNFTSDDAAIPFPWLCGSTDFACGITTRDPATGGQLGNFLIGAPNFGSGGVNVFGFVDPGESIFRKIRSANSPLAVDKRVQYEVSFDACLANNTAGVTQNIFLTVHVTGENDTVPTPINVASTAITLFGNLDNSSCGSVLLRVPHYLLFNHVGVFGLSVTISADSAAARVFLDNVRVAALPTISNEDGDSCFGNTDLTVVPAGTPACTRVFINEINYRNITFTGMDFAPTEAIEIAGPVGIDLSDMKILLVDFHALGGTNPLVTQIVMGAVPGTVTIPESPESPGFGFVKVGFSQGLPNGDDSLQGIDGVAFFIDKDQATPTQFICFGPLANVTATANGFTCSQVVDLNFQSLNDSTDAGSLSLVGCGNCYEDFDWAFTDTATITNDTALLPFQNTGQSLCRDFDGDGFWESTCCNGNDCNDRISWIFPGAREICDGELTNCIGFGLLDGEVDNDGDGRLQCDGDCNDVLPDGINQFGSASIFVDGAINTTALLCSPVLIVNTPTVNNSHPEACDLLDNDCDGLTNEAFVHLFHFRDSDHDGFADVNAPDNDLEEFPNCQVFDPNDNCTVIFPFGWAPNRTDCNDTNPLVHPDGASRCRRNDTCEDANFFNFPIDDNCNGIFDEFDVIDLDRDGFANVSASAGGDLASFAIACPLRLDAINPDGDCDDSRATVNPNATEVCNRRDDNCNGETDEGLFIDLDNDTFGAPPPVSSATCIGVYPLTDCDDRNDTTFNGIPIGNFSNPGRVEVFCDGLNNDCNAATPDSRAETCDRIDTDCNCGLSNDPNITTFVPVDSATCNTTLFNDDFELYLDNGVVVDLDDDVSYAISAANRATCAVAGYVFDCNDTDSSIPRVETCDGIDDDCDGLIDEIFFNDTDGDLFPDQTPDASCAGFHNFEVDCAPTNPAINPGVNESILALYCNDVNDDCNAATPVGVDGVLHGGGEGALSGNFSDAILFDEDGDGFRDFTDNGDICKPLVLSDAFFGFGTGLFDCADQDPNNHPCRPDEFVCLTRIGGVRPVPAGAACGVDEHRVCGRELTVNPTTGLIQANGQDNDCADGVDNIVNFAVHLSLQGEFFDATTTSSSSDSNDDDDDSSSSSSSSSKSDQFCADIKVTLTADLPANPAIKKFKDVVIKGQLELPPKGQLKEYIFGDLENFGVKVDTRTLRVAWVQFTLDAGASQEVVFPVCVRRREHIFGVKLTLQLEDYSLEIVPAVVPEPFNIQTTTAQSGPISITPNL